MILELCETDSDWSTIHMVLSARWELLALNRMWHNADRPTYIFGDIRPEKCCISKHTKMVLGVKRIILMPKPHFRQKRRYDLLALSPRHSVNRNSKNSIIDPNNILIVLIHNLKTAWPAKNFNAIFSVPWVVNYKMHILFFKKVLMILR